MKQTLIINLTKKLNGNVEFKSWLEALVNEKDSELNLLKAKFDIIQAENKIYQAMGGKAK